MGETIKGSSKTPQTASINTPERPTMFSIRHRVPEHDGPDTSTVGLESATLRLTHKAHDELRRYVERSLRSPVPGGALNTAARELERLFLDEAIRIAHFNQSKASRLLGISRPTFRAKLVKHGLLKENKPRRPGKPR
jgi:DNA-binding protein Fis